MQISQEEYDRLVVGRDQYDDSLHRRARSPMRFAKPFACVCIALLAGTFLLVNWNSIKAHIPGAPTIVFATDVPKSASAASPTMVIPPSKPPAAPPQSPFNPNSSAGLVPGGSPGTPATATVVATATATSVPMPCVLTTWPNGSQSCSDGRSIDAAHGQPGYCTPTVWGDGSVSCNDGKPSGNVVWPDPELQAEPSPSPWPAAPSDGVQWTAADGPNNNTCVTVGTQTACSDPNVKLDSDDAAFVARMIEDGKIAPGVGVPKG